MKRVILSLIHLLLIHTEGYSTGSISRGFTFTLPRNPSRFTAILASSNMEFAAGFLTDPDTGLSSFAVVGTDDLSSGSVLDIIWTANRNSPFGGTGMLVFANDTGQLQIVSGSSLLWESSAGGDVLELSDYGNLILAKRNVSETLWQSFDHPTNVLMQTQNFTGSMQLTSDSGEYSLRMNKDRLVLYADNGPYWMTSALREQNSPGNDSNVYVRIQSEGYLGMYANETRIHFVPFSSLNRLSGNVTRRARLDSDGNLRVYYWLNGQRVEDYTALNAPCEYPNACGAYGICSPGNIPYCKCPVAEVLSFTAVDGQDSHKGCKPARGVVDVCAFTSYLSSLYFLEMNGVDYLPIDLTASIYPGAVSVSTFEHCKALCLSNCSCKAFFFRNDTGLCFVTDTMRSMQQSGDAQDVVYIKVGEIPTAGRDNSRRGLGIFFLVLTVALGISLLAVGLCYFRAKRSQKYEFSDEQVQQRRI